MKGYISINMNEYGYFCRGIFTSLDYLRQNNPNAFKVIEVELPDLLMAQVEPEKVVRPEER